jgi:hypothetical protein
MADRDPQALEDERLTELRETAEAVGKLAEKAEVFNAVVEAFRAEDTERFQAGIAAVGIDQWCHLVCRWLCSKHCVYLCVRLCGPLEEQREAGRCGLVRLVCRSDGRRACTLRRARVYASGPMRITVKPKRKDELLIEGSAFGCRVDGQVIQN